LTVAGICAAVAVAASQSQVIFEQLQKYFGASPYYFFVQEVRYEIAIIIILAILVYNARALPFFAGYSQMRERWRLGKIGPAGHALHVEEWALVLTLAALIVSFSYHSFWKTMRAYQSYGLMYVASNACEGRMGDALERIKSLRGNHLWDKYRVELSGAADRYGYLDKMLVKRLNQFREAQGRLPMDELLAQAVEIEAIFGVDVRQSVASLGPAELSGIVQDWKTFIEKRSCAPGA
jgi:hypothetical protein